MNWVIDELDVVHVRECDYIYEGFEPYICAPETLAEMAEHLALPDSTRSHGSATFGQSPLAPCWVCVLGNDPEESYPPSLQARCTAGR